MCVDVCVSFRMHDTRGSLVLLQQTSAHKVRPFLSIAPGACNIFVDALDRLIKCDDLDQVLHSTLDSSGGDDDNDDGARQQQQQQGQAGRKRSRPSRPRRGPSAAVEQAKQHLHELRAHHEMWTNALSAEHGQGHAIAPAARQPEGQLLFAPQHFQGSFPFPPLPTWQGSGP